MTESIAKHQRTIASLIHASTFSRFFLPLGNFIGPLVLWLIHRKDNPLADHHGKQVLNFQMSLMLYALVLGVISIPMLLGMFPRIFDWDMFSFWSWNHSFSLNWHSDWGLFRGNPFWWPLGLAGVAHVILMAINIIYSILGAIRTHEGRPFSYPLTIKFIR